MSSDVTGSSCESNGHNPEASVTPFDVPSPAASPVALPALSSTAAALPPRAAAAKQRASSSRTPAASPSVSAAASPSVSAATSPSVSAAASPSVSAGASPSVSAGASPALSSTAAAPSPRAAAAKQRGTSWRRDSASATNEMAAVLVQRTEMALIVDIVLDASFITKMGPAGAVVIDAVTAGSAAAAANLTEGDVVCRVNGITVAEQIIAEVARCVELQQQMQIEVITHGAKQRKLETAQQLLQAAMQTEDPQAIALAEAALREAAEAQRMAADSVLSFIQSPDSWVADGAEHEMATPRGAEDSLGIDWSLLSPRSRQRRCPLQEPLPPESPELSDATDAHGAEIPAFTLDGEEQSLGDKVTQLLEKLKQVEAQATDPDAVASDGQCGGTDAQYTDAYVLELQAKLQAAEAAVASRCHRSKGSADGEESYNSDKDAIPSTSDDGSDNDLPHGPGAESHSRLSSAKQSAKSRKQSAKSRKQFRKFQEPKRQVSKGRVLPERPAYISDGRYSSSPARSPKSQANSRKSPSKPVNVKPKFDLEASLSQKPQWEMKTGKVTKQNPEKSTYMSRGASPKSHRPATPHRGFSSKTTASPKSPKSPVSIKPKFDLEASLSQKPQWEMKTGKVAPLHPPDYTGEPRDLAPKEQRRTPVGPSWNRSLAATTWLESEQLFCAEGAPPEGAEGSSSVAFQRGSSIPMAAAARPNKFDIAASLAKKVKWPLKTGNLQKVEPLEAGCCLILRDDGRYSPQRARERRGKETGKRERKPNVPKFDRALWRCGPARKYAQEQKPRQAKGTRSAPSIGQEEEEEEEEDGQEEEAVDGQEEEGNSNREDSEECSESMVLGSDRQIQDLQGTESSLATYKYPLSPEIWLSAAPPPYGSIKLKLESARSTESLWAWKSPRDRIDNSAADVEDLEEATGGARVLEEENHRSWERWYIPSECAASIGHEVQKRSTLQSTMVVVMQEASVTSEDSESDSSCSQDADAEQKLQEWGMWIRGCSAVDSYIKTCQHFPVAGHSGLTEDGSESERDSIVRRDCTKDSKKGSAIEQCIQEGSKEGPVQGDWLSNEVLEEAAKLRVSKEPAKVDCVQHPPDRAEAMAGVASQLRGIKEEMQALQCSATHAIATCKGATQQRALGLAAVQVGFESTFRIAPIQVPPPLDAPTRLMAPGCVGKPHNVM